jgi:hypothetical protein
MIQPSITASWPLPLLVYFRVFSSENGRYAPGTVGFPEFARHYNPCFFPLAVVVAQFY